MFERYIIKNGESLNEVAKKYNTSVKILTDLNNIYLESDVRAGMEIVVPTESKDYFNYYVVEKGDNLYAIARKYNINPQLLANINGLDEDDYIYPKKVRTMQKQLKIITDYLGYKNVSTHSFRKLFAHTIYEESGYDIELVRHVLNHSDIKTTMRYLGVSMKKLKDLSNKIDFSYAL